MKMETVEHFAKIALVSRMIGREQPLNDEDVQKLIVARRKYAGTRTAAPMPVHSTRGNSGSRIGPVFEPVKSRN